MSARRRFDPYSQGVGVVSSWIVAALAVIAFMIVRDRIAEGHYLRFAWIALVAAAFLRALYRTWIYYKRWKAGPTRNDGATGPGEEETP